MLICKFLTNNRFWRILGKICFFLRHNWAKVWSKLPAAFTTHFVQAHLLILMTSHVVGSPGKFEMPSRISPATVVVLISACATSSA